MQTYDVVSYTNEHLSDERLAIALRVHTTVRQILGDFFRSRGFIEVPPVIISPLTDPLNHPVYDPYITYYDEKYALTKSMIFHKHLLVSHFDKIFTFSPNIRIETPDKAETGRHLSEFTQIDVEARGATREQMMSLVEDLMVELVSKVKEKHADDLRKLGRKLEVPRKPFRRYQYLEAEKEYGKDFEAVLSRKEKDMFWIIDIPLQAREFYDREDPSRPGILVDMDLIYPEGFQEALSGGEREYQLDRILERIKKKGQTEEQFKWYIEFARRGLPPSAGFGIGIERLVRYICGFKRIDDVHPFPKVPGKFSL
ncbi:asparagine synthetase A [Thermogymnomonas acidicola]|nr:asparagine synthetase A [Thermogymnomonas acidicola]